MIKMATFVKVRVSELVDLCRKNRENPLSAQFLIACQGLSNDHYVYIEEPDYQVLSGQNNLKLNEVLEKTVIKDIDTGEDVEVEVMVKKVEYM